MKEIHHSNEYLLIFFQSVVKNCILACDDFIFSNAKGFFQSHIQILSYFELFV